MATALLSWSWKTYREHVCLEELTVFSFSFAKLFSSSKRSLFSALSLYLFISSFCTRWFSISCLRSIAIFEIASRREFRSARAASSCDGSNPEVVLKYYFEHFEYSKLSCNFFQSYRKTFSFAVVYIHRSNLVVCLQGENFRL